MTSELAYTLTKPFAIIVEVKGQSMKKEFDTEEEVMAFARSLKERLPEAKAEFIRRKERLKGIDGYPYSLGFEPVIDKRTGRVLINGFGKPTYKPVPVPPKKGLLFCAHCHDYRKFIRIRTKHGLEYTGCEECNLSTKDFNIKTCNRLWGKGS